MMIMIPLTCHSADAQETRPTLPMFSGLVTQFPMTTEMTIRPTNWGIWLLSLLTNTQVAVMRRSPDYAARVRHSYKPSLGRILQHVDAYNSV